MQFWIFSSFLTKLPLCQCRQFSTARKSIDVLGAQFWSHLCRITGSLQCISDQILVFLMKNISCNKHYYLVRLSLLSLLSFICSKISDLISQISNLCWIFSQTFLKISTTSLSQSSHSLHFVKQLMCLVCKLQSNLWCGGRTVLKSQNKGERHKRCIVQGIINTDFYSWDDKKEQEIKAILYWQ